MIAARTDEKLRGTFQTSSRSTARRSTTSRALPGAENFPEESFPALVALMTNAFDGAALVRPVLPQRDIEARRIKLLMSLLSPASSV